MSTHRIIYKSNCAQFSTIIEQMEASGIIVVQRHKMW